MAEEVGNGAATGSKAPKVRVIDASVIAEGAVELIRCTLKELFHGDLVDAALNKAMKTPAVKALIARSKTKGKPKSAKVRSAYQVFVTVCLAKLLASGHRSTIMEAGVLWKALPAIQREQMIARFNLFKDYYNSKLDEAHDEEGLGVVEELAAYEADNHLEPYDYVKLMRRHGVVAATSNGAAPAEPMLTAAPSASTPKEKKRKAIEGAATEKMPKAKKAEQVAPAPVPISPAKDKKGKKGATAVLSASSPAVRPPRPEPAAHKRSAPPVPVQQEESQEESEEEARDVDDDGVGDEDDDNSEEDEDDSSED